MVKQERVLDVLERESRPFSKGFLIAIGGWGAPAVIIGAKDEKQVILGVTSAICGIVAVAIAHDLFPFSEKK